jgi:hypothetical protein
MTPPPDSSAAAACSLDRRRAHLADADYCAGPTSVSRKASIGRARRRPQTLPATRACQRRLRRHPVGRVRPSRIPRGRMTCASPVDVVQASDPVGVARNHDAGPNAYPGQECWGALGGSPRHPVCRNGIQSRLDGIPYGAGVASVRPLWSSASHQTAVITAMPRHLGGWLGFARSLALTFGIPSGTIWRNGQPTDPGPGTNPRDDPSRGTRSWRSGR